MQVMVDIECYGEEDGFLLLQLSAVAFDMDGKINDPHELIQTDDCWFDAIVVGDSRVAATPLSILPVNRDTIEWWAHEQQAPARAVLLRAAKERAEPVRDALARFSRFLRPRLGKKGGLWANSPSYDLKAMRDLYEELGMPVPWHYRNERDMRTLMVLVKKLGPTKMPDMDGIGLVPHLGLHDAARQAVLVQAGYRALGLNAGDYARSVRSSGAAS